MALTAALSAAAGPEGRGGPGNDTPFENPAVEHRLNQRTVGFEMAGDFRQRCAALPGEVTLDVRQGHDRDADGDELMKNKRKGRENDFKRTDKEKEREIAPDEKESEKYFMTHNKCHQLISRCGIGEVCTIPDLFVY
jgi:hypothetical protein